MKLTKNQTMMLSDLFEAEVLPIYVNDRRTITLLVKKGLAEWHGSYGRITLAGQQHVIARETSP